MKIVRHSILLKLIVVCLLYQPLQSVPLVYNMRIRRAFVLPENFAKIDARGAVTILPISYSRTSDIDDVPNLLVHEKRKIRGAIINGQYTPSRHWWVDATTGLERDHVKFTGDDPFKVSQFGFDDLLFTAGYRYFKDDRTQIIGYGLFGIPLRQKVDATDKYGPLIGSRFYNIGIGAEYSYAFMHNLQRAFLAIAQGRFIHGFKRSWTPILPKGSSIIPGNFSDILVALQYRERRTIFQIGYDATIFNNQGVKTLTETRIANSFIRNSWYGTIAHGSLEGFFDKPTYYGLGTSISRTKKFNARTFIIWAFLTQAF